MGLLTKPAALTSINRALYSWLNSRVDDLYNIIGTTLNGRGSLNYLNLSATADLAPSQGRGTFATLTDPDALGTQTVTRATKLTNILVGTGTEVVYQGGLLDAQTAFVGNVGAGEDTLMSYTVPANTLVETGRAIRITCTGLGANNANAKRLRLYFGAAEILDITITTGSARAWKIEALVVRTGASAQDYHSIIIEGANAGAAVAAVNGAQLMGTSAETETAAIIIKMTGEATSDADITQEMMVIEFL